MAWCTSRRSPMSVWSASPTSSRKATRCASRYSRWIGRVASACPCVISTPPDAAAWSGADAPGAASVALTTLRRHEPLRGGRRGADGLHQRAENLILSAVPALIVLMCQLTGGGRGIAARGLAAEEQSQALFEVAR